jgi:hypothetical protein
MDTTMTSVRASSINPMINCRIEVSENIRMYDSSIDDQPQMAWQSWPVFARNYVLHPQRLDVGVTIC